jgi:hypothetical protein
MNPTTCRGGLALAILLTFLTGQLFAQTPKDKPAKDKQPPEKMAEPKPDPAKVAKQKKEAAAHWKRIVEESPQQFESDHLLIVAPGSTKNLPQMATYLEKAYDLAAKALKMEAGELWPGKLTVYLVNDRGQYKSFMRSVIKKQAEEDDRGGFQNEGEAPTAVGGPPVNALDLKVEQEAANQVAQALLAQKAKAKVPDWVILGFGRATVLRAGSPATYAREKQAVRILVIKKKRTSREIWTGSENIKIAEAAILRGSLVDFLAYGGVTQRFPDFVTGYRVRDKKNLNPTTENAFSRADINPETLEAGWRAWLAR